MDLIVNYGTESHVIPTPTETVTFVGRAGKDGLNGTVDNDVLAGFLTKIEANDRFALLEASIRINSELISLTVTRTEFDLLGNKLNQLETSINQTALSITLLATKSELNKTNGRLTQAEASLQITASGLALKASQSSVDSLGQRLTTAEASLTVTANAINSKVSKTEFDAFYNSVGTRFSSIEQTATSITQIVQGLPTIEYVNSKIESIPYNGLNLYSKTTPLFYNASTLNQRTASGFNVTGIPQNTGEIRLGNVIKSNGWHTISFFARAPIPLQLGIDFCDGTNIPFTITSESKYFQFSYNVNNYSSNVYNFIDIKGLGAQIHYFDKIKVEKGSKATEWSEQPEDYTEVFNTYNTRITQIESAIQLLATKTTTDALGNRLSQAEASLTVQANQIQSKVSQTNFDVLTGRMSNAESAITQTSSQISSKVSYTDYNGATIASLINQSPTTVKIAAKNISLEGAVTASSLNSGRTKINVNSNGDFEFFHGNGTLAFRMTTLSDGKAVFQAFNDGGEKVFDIDTVSQSGIQYITTVPDSVKAYQLNRIGNYSSEDPVGAELTTIINNTKALFTYINTTYPGYTRESQNVTISKLSNPNAYYLVAGTYQGSDANVPFNGYHQQQTFGSAYITDGWYMIDDAFVGVKHHPTDVSGTQTGSVSAFAVVSGKVVSRKDLIITL